MVTNKVPSAAKAKRTYSMGMVQDGHTCCLGFANQYEPGGKINHQVAAIGYSFITRNTANGSLTINSGIRII